MQKIITRAALCILSLLLVAQAVCAGPSPIFNVSHAPPPGFTAAAKPQKILVDVYYTGIHLGAFPAIVTPTTIKFIHPEYFLSKIKRLKHLPSLAHVLKRTLPAHSNLLCQGGQTGKTCGELSPRSIGVIYNPINFSAEIFINPKFVGHRKINPFALLPDSTAGFSYTNKLDTVFAGSTNSHDEFTDLSNTASDNYNLTTDNTFADGNNKGEVSLSFANHINSINQVLVNQADLQRTAGKYQYSLGIIQTTGSQFFPNVSILGAQFATTLNTMPDALDKSATPLIIYLNFPSQVSFYKDGQLIYTAYMQGGYQHVDTRDFPQGAYQLSVKIVDSQGKSSIQHYYYVKSADLPPKGLPQYSITTGYEVAMPQYDDATSTRILDIPVYQLDYNWRLDNTMGISINALGSDRNFFAAAGPVWLYGPIEVNLGGLIGTGGRYGVTTNASYTMNRFSVTGSYLQLFNNEDSKNFKASKTNTYYDRLLTPNNTQLSGSLAYRLTQEISANLIGTYNKPASTATTYSYGANLTWNTGITHAGQLSISLGANRSTNDYTIMLNFVLTLDTPNRSVSLQTGYLYQRGINTPTTQLNSSGAQAAASINWFDTDSNHYGYNVGLHGNISPTSRNAGATYSNTNHYFDASVYGNYNARSNFGDYNTQYGGEIKTQLSIMNGLTLISNPTIGTNAGVVAYVSSPDPHAQFMVHRKEHPGFLIDANRHYLLHLEPFDQYHLEVSNASKDVFAIKNPERSVTLYPGNLQQLHWRAVRQTVIIGRLIGPDGTMMPDAKLTAGLGDYFTDAQGYFQMNVASTHPKVTVHYQGKKYELLLHSLNSKKDYTYLGDTHCVLLK